MKTRLSLSVLLIAAFLLTACGPSPEQIATMTASAWTPTPKPTATPTITPSPTPVPYDLTVKVVDEQGNPVTWATASVKATASKQGIGKPTLVDQSGQASWAALSEGNVTVKVSAQGYTASEQAVSLQPGPNEQTVALTRVPFGLLPSQACAPGETQLYAEDFQDSYVENWGAYPPGTKIPIEADPLAPENKALVLDFGNQDGGFQVKTIPLQDNVVRRLKYLPGNHSRFSVGWGKGNLVYFAVLGGDEISLNFYSEATGEQKLAVSKPVMAQGVWHLLEISIYNGKIEVWADGKLAVSYEGATALTEGNVMETGSGRLPPDSIVRIDDISICSLSAPFVPMPAAAP